MLEVYWTLSVHEAVRLKARSKQALGTIYTNYHFAIKHELSIPGHLKFQVDLDARLLFNSHFYFQLVKNYYMNILYITSTEMKYFFSLIFHVYLHFLFLSVILPNDIVWTMRTFLII